MNWGQVYFISILSHAFKILLTEVKYIFSLSATGNSIRKGCAMIILYHSNHNYANKIDLTPILLVDWFLKPEMV
jgi:hypothetical protein